MSRKITNNKKFNSRVKNKSVKRNKKIRKTKIKVGKLIGGAMGMAATNGVLPELKLPLNKEYLKDNPKVCDFLYDETMKLLDSFPVIQTSSIKPLLQKWFKKSEEEDKDKDKKKKLFDPYLTLPIPFITDVQNSDNFETDFYYKWYIEKNPDLGILISDKGTITPIDTSCTIKVSGETITFPIYETLMAQICRDICLFLITGHFFVGDDNDDTNLKIEEDYLEKFKTLLFECNGCIGLKYNYYKVCLIFDMFISYISRRKTIIEQAIYTTCDYFPLLYNSKFIFFPTPSQLSYQSVVLLIGSPIINFRLNNRVRYIHKLILPPINNFAHDVFEHCSVSHNIKFFTKIDKDSVDNIFNEWFSNISNLIKILSKYFFIKPKDKNKDSKYPYDKITIKTKTMYSFILFSLLHEFNGGLALFKTIIRQIDDQIKKIKEFLIRDLIETAISSRLSSAIKKIDEIDRNDEFWKTYNWSPIIDYFINTIIAKANRPKTGEEFKQNINILYDILLLIYKRYKSKVPNFLFEFNPDLRGYLEENEVSNKFENSINTNGKFPIQIIKTQT